MRPLLAGLLIGFLTLVVGCKEDPPKAVPVAPRQAASRLKVLVVDDPGIAAGLKLLRGEWSERSGGQLEVTEATVEELLASKELSADLIVYPSRHLGTLVAREWLRPLRKSVLEGEGVAREGFYPLIRNTVLPYGNEVYGLTLGESPLLLASSGASNKPLTSWESVDVQLEVESSPLPYPRAVELLLRGTCSAQVRGQSVGWFDVDSMQPKILGPPFAKALTEMVENEKNSENLNVKLAIGWPAAFDENFGETVVYLPLPKAKQVYDPLRDLWQKSEAEQTLVFLGFAGRSVSVTRATRNSSSAFKLLRWLISEDISTQLSPRSDETVWFRKSQASKAKNWLTRNKASDASAGETVLLVSWQLASDRAFLLPRIPAIDEYLQSLDVVVGRAVSGQVPVEAALAEVEAQWNALTDRQGRERQRLAYRKHLGLDDSNE